MESYRQQPIGIDIIDFRKLRESNAVYIDKTEYLWNLVRVCGTKFLARPRRFGKSMFLSTLNCFFQGKRELFEGLAISRKDYDWKSYPVINLSFASCDTFVFNTAEKLNLYLSGQVREIAGQFGIVLHASMSAAAMFRELILTLAREVGDVVILIDEYDKPVSDHFYDPELPELLATMKAFYSVIKDCNQYERFAFVTGVTKIALTSFYSSFNNPEDISMEKQYATLFGYTQEELEHYFGDRLEGIARKQKMTIPELLAAMKDNYDGYRFHRDEPTVYNPVSIGYFFKNDGEFSNYWIDTGTPRFLLDTMRKENIDIASLLRESYTEQVFKAFDWNQISIPGLLLQTGYLTIRSAEKDGLKWLYYLSFPNYEVREAFQGYLINLWSNLENEVTSKTVGNIRKAFINEDLPLLKDVWFKIFSKFIYDLRGQLEYAYQTVFFVFCLIVAPGKTEAEQHTSLGRIDTVIETETAVFLFEFKINAPVGEHAALKQIYTKDYGSRYRFDGKHVYAVGINFSSENGSILEYDSEPYNEKKRPT